MCSTAPTQLGPDCAAAGAYLVSEFGDRPLSTITRADVAHVIDQVQAKGFAIGANRTLANFKTFFRWCVERGLIERSPADYLRPPSVEISRDRILSDAELRAVSQAAKAEGYPYGDIVRLLILTAQRREEVAGMHWSELDLSERRWTLAADRTKSGRLHVVPPCDHAIEILNGIEPVGALVFPARNDLGGDRPLSGWSKAKTRLDLSSGVTNWRLHDLRRTAASGMARLGVEPHLVERVLNLATSGLGPLAKVYQRYDYAAEKRSTLDAWSDVAIRITCGAQNG